PAPTPCEIDGLAKHNILRPVNVMGDFAQRRPLMWRALVAAVKISHDVEAKPRSHDHQASPAGEGLARPPREKGLCYPLGAMAKSSARGTESVDEPPHPPSGVVDTLTRLHVLHLDDTPAAPPDGVDSVHFESAVADEPRHHLLSHCPCVLH